jgi:hypothetical protein
MDPAASIWVKLQDGPAKRSACRKGDPVININGIKQLSFEGLANPHWNVFLQLNRQ